MEPCTWTLQWEVTHDEYIAAFRYVTLAGERGEQLAKMSRRVHGVFSLVITAACALVGLYVFAPPSSGSPGFLVFAVLFMVVLFVMNGAKWLRWHMRRRKPGYVEPAIERAVKMYTTDLARNPAQAPEGPMVLEVTSDNVIEYFDGSTAIHEWSVFDRVVEAPGYAFLLLKRTTSIGVPDRAFASPEERAAFIADVRTRMQKGAPVGAPLINA